MMKLEGLLAFTMVADAGSISEAARRLGVSKSVVSEPLSRIRARAGWKTSRALRSHKEALFWEAAAGGLRAHQYWNEMLGKKTLEYRLDSNPPRAARAFVLPFVTLYDAAIACSEAKYTYWAIRPLQLDPEVKPIFVTPNHPSYPAAHACSSIAVTKVLGYVFPRDAETLAALGERAAESRIRAGIHHRSDINAGRQLAIAVADKVIERAEHDGAEQ